MIIWGAARDVEGLESARLEDLEALLQVLARHVLAARRAAAQMAVLAGDIALAGDVDLQDVELLVARAVLRRNPLNEGREGGQCGDELWAGGGVCGCLWHRRLQTGA